MPIMGLWLPKVSLSMTLYSMGFSRTAATVQRWSISSRKGVAGLRIEQSRFVAIEKETLSTADCCPITAAQPRRDLFASDTARRQHQDDFCAQRLEGDHIALDRLPIRLLLFFVQILRANAEN